MIKSLTIGISQQYSDFQFLTIWDLLPFQHCGKVLFFNDTKEIFVKLFSLHCGDNRKERQEQWRCSTVSPLLGSSIVVTIHLLTLCEQTTTSQLPNVFDMALLTEHCWTHQQQQYFTN